MTTKKSVTPATESFKTLFDITKSWCYIDPSINYNSIVHRKKERWIILLDIWKQNTRRVGKNIFLNPLTHIFRGEYLTHKGIAQIKLFHEIEATLMNNSEVFEIWIQTKVFQDALFSVLKQTIKIAAFPQFQIAQAMLRLLNGKNLSNFAKLPAVCAYSIFKLTNFTYNSNMCNRMKARIAVILPDSKYWNADQWASSSLVCEAINASYGLEFYTTRGDLEAIIDLIDHASIPSSESALCHIANANINYGIVKAIFKNKADDTILELFDAVTRLTNEGEYWQLRADRTWMYKIIEAWACDKNHPRCHEAKKKVFDLTMAGNT